MTLNIQASPVPAVPHARRFPWYVLIAPGIVALGILAMRLAVHDGSWQVVPAYVALLAICGLGALTSSAFAAYASAEGRRQAAFLGWFTAQIAASAGLMTALWWLLPLRFVGP